MLNARATDVPHYSAKTPAASSKNRRENVYQGAMTVHNGKAKNLRTPFQPKSAQPQRLHTKAPPIQLVTKPLADKTPFANRVLDDYKTPGPVLQPLKPLSLGTSSTLQVPPNPNPSPGSARASSARKHARTPKPQFQTPANVGNHWDISDDDILVPQIDESEKQVEEDPLDFNDEIEYMPPNTLNLEYQPPFDFDLPNYKLLGQDIFHKFHSYPEEETAPPPPTFEFTFHDEEFMKWDDLSLPSLSPSDDDIGTRPRHNSKQSQVTRISSSATVKKPAGSTRSVSAMNLRSKDTTSASTVTTKKPTGSARSASVMDTRRNIKTPASTRLNRPASSVSLKPPPKSTTGTTRSQARTGTTMINTTSASSRTAPKPPLGTSTKTKPRQATTTLVDKTATATAIHDGHPKSNIPRPSSTARSIRPASAIGVNSSTSRAANATTVKRPSTSTSVMRPRPRASTTAMTATSRSSTSASVQRGMKSSLIKTKGPPAGTILNIKADKKPLTTLSGVKPMTKGGTASKSMIKGKMLSSDTTLKKNITPIQDPVDEAVVSRLSAGVDVASLEHTETKLKEDQNDGDDDDGDQDDSDEYDEEETIRLVVQPKPQDIVNETSRLKEIAHQPSSSKDSIINVTADKIIYQGGEIDIEEGGEFNLSTVEEVTEVSISVDLVERLEILKLE